MGYSFTNHSLVIILTMALIYWPKTRTLLIKMGSLPVFNHRVGNISAGQAGNTYRQAINRNQQGSNRQARNCVAQVGLIFLTHGLSVMKSLSFSGKWACAMHHLESGL